MVQILVKGAYKQTTQQNQLSKPLFQEQSEVVY